MKNVSSVLLSLSLLSLVACGNDHNGRSLRPDTKSMLLSEAGYYEAKLIPLNTHLAGDVSGIVNIKVKEDIFTAEVKIDGAPSQIMHAQKIHLSDACPTLSSDLNNDGIVDAIEGQKSYGPVIIPLDYSLETQIEKDSKYPSSDFSGNFYYTQSASMLKMMQDLTSRDNNSKDEIVKISSSLGLSGRQVVIYGIDENTILPDSVASFKGQSKHATLPIACGTLVKVPGQDELTSSGAKD